MKFNSEERQAIVDAMIEAGVTASVILILILVALGIDIFVTIIPVILLMSIGGFCVTIGLAMTLYRKGVVLFESTHKDKND